MTREASKQVAAIRELVGRARDAMRKIHANRTLLKCTEELWLAQTHDKLKSVVAGLEHVVEAVERRPGYALPVSGWARAKAKAEAAGGGDDDETND